MVKRKLISLGIRDVSQRGGSLSITIPGEVAELLDIKAGDIVIFLYNKEEKHIIFSKLPPTITTPSGLTFSISKELAKKLLKEEGKSGKK